MYMLIEYFTQKYYYTGLLSLSGFGKKSEIVWRLLADWQNTRRKNLHTIHVPIVCFWSYVSLAGIQNVRENESCLWKSKCKRTSYWKSKAYVVKSCHMVGSKHTVYFAWDKIKVTDIVGSINHVTSLTNSFLISWLTSTIFASETSESVSYFLEFSCIMAIQKKCRSVNPIGVLLPLALPAEIIRSHLETGSLRIRLRFFTSQLKSSWVSRIKSTWRI